MGTGIMICGLNGTGKSTLGSALASELKYHFIDHEEVYFSNSTTQYRYANPRTKEEAQEYFSKEIQTHEDFVFASNEGRFSITASTNASMDCRTYCAQGDPSEARQGAFASQL